MEEELKIILENEEEIKITLEEQEELGVDLETDTTEVVTSDYEKLNNLPKINSEILLGDKSFTELGLTELTNSEIEEILK